MEEKIPQLPPHGVFKGSGLLFQWLNDTGRDWLPEYASITAPEVCGCSVKVDGSEVDFVYAGGGGSHSWWSAAGGRLIRYPLKPGQTLSIETDADASFRIDWYE